MNLTVNLTVYYIKTDALVYSQLFLPKWLSSMLRLNFIRTEPTNRLGAMFRQMLRERKRTGHKYNDLNEALESAIDKGLQMDEDTKLANDLLGNFAVSWNSY